VDTETVAKSPAEKQEFLVTARLIYEDGSLSAFDVLNDKSVALSNTIIGGGDAEKASESVQLTVAGEAGRFHLKVWNGRQVAIDADTSANAQPLIYIIKKTGCDEVIVEVTRGQSVLYRDTIPFHCQE
jgi:hypothetical protein